MFVKVFCKTGFAQSSHFLIASACYKLSKRRKQLIFVSPGCVHNSTRLGGVLQDLEPPSGIIKGIAIIISTRQSPEA